MTSRGLLFAINTEDEKKILSAKDDESLMEIIEELEEEWVEENLVEADKAWDAIHRVLTDGHLLYENGERPLNLTILGGRQLHRGDDYTVAYVSKEQVAEVAGALLGITKDWFKGQYFGKLKAGGYEMELSDDDFEYSWQYFDDIRNFYIGAKKRRFAVLFTVDQ